MAIDLSSLPESVREEISRLEEPETEPIETGEVPTEETILQLKDKTPRSRKRTAEPGVSELVKAVTEQSQQQTQMIRDALLASQESSRVVQGQIRALESRLNSVAQQPAKARSDPFANLDKDDPSQMALAQVLRPFMERLETLEAGNQYTTISARDRAERESWMAYLQDFASEIGVDFSKVSKELSGVATSDLGLTGKNLLLKEFKESKSKAKPEDVTELTKERDALRQLLRDSGVYENLRTAGGGVGAGDIERASHAADAFQKGEISREQLEAEHKRL